MTKVAVYREPSDSESLPYRAVAGGSQAKGRTAGEALDALTSQLNVEESDTIVIVRSMRPDRFFNSEQRRRLEELVSLRRDALGRNSALSNEEQVELERLVDAEVQAAQARATALFDELRQ